jgi:mannose-6-phosphate isomerase-like protein (cupin superfamily)
VTVGGIIRSVVAGVVLALAAPPAFGASAGPGAGAGAGPGVQVVDVAKVVAGIERDSADKSDVSQTFYASPAASVHLHVVGREQTVPLHLHRVTEEATVVVTGAPLVTHVYGRGGGRQTKERTVRAGTVICSPPFTGHEWFNPDARRMQANLVIASPPFDGNFYVKPGDRRLLEGGEPLIVDPDEALRAFLASDAQSSIRPLPMRREKLVSVLVRGEVTLPAHPASPTLIYVTSGAGELHLDGETGLRAGLLLNVPPGVPVRIRAAKGSPLALIAFRPEA